MKRCAVVVAVALLAMACGGPDSAKGPAPADPNGSTPPKPPVVSGEVGTIEGSVTFVWKKGNAPVRQKIPVNKDKEACLKSGDLYKEDLVVGPAGQVQWAVVYLPVVNVANQIPSSPVVVDQKSCRFDPRVVIVPPGVNVVIKNSDGILHNIHTYSDKNPSMNVAMPKFKKEITRKFKEPEFIRIECDVHSWMRGWIVVTGNPYYSVTDVNGIFKLENVPAGSYLLSVWHEKLGKQTVTVVVGPGKTTFVDLGFYEI